MVENVIAKQYGKQVLKQTLAVDLSRTFGRKLGGCMSVFESKAAEMAWEKLTFEQKLAFKKRLEEEMEKERQRNKNMWGGK